MNDDRLMARRWMNHPESRDLVSGVQRRPGVGRTSAFVDPGAERRCWYSPFQMAMHPTVGRTLLQMGRQYQERA